MQILNLKDGPLVGVYHKMVALVQFCFSVVNLSLLTSVTSTTLIVLYLFWTHTQDMKTPNYTELIAMFCFGRAQKTRNTE